ncbi:type II toxin-antitoxin system ParD family antitoxin [Cecembia calidifontis]|jgi:antitoxin ParD1/3/4|uniref:Antitoxin ParD1/3/4 n=1 Tax=Cecembia calidifontis TaxID=1187080 RepID=A0A4Q7P9G9_9BACT|nr:type II toxin-antitoxin system ParD family antitoxin [Cecembia calidifontis]RZS96863.1 antitoxin ParD1/3/4 [Cecembia calidifontis]
MSTIRKTLTFTEQQDKWIKAQIKDGGFTNESEYIRHLIREDQARNKKFIRLKESIKEGIDSGISEKTVKDIMNEVQSRLKSDGQI